MGVPAFTSPDCGREGYLFIKAREQLHGNVLPGVWSGRLGSSLGCATHHTGRLARLAFLLSLGLLTCEMVAAPTNGMMLLTSGPWG